MSGQYSIWNWSNVPNTKTVTQFSSLKAKIFCFFETLPVHFFTFPALHSADKFTNEEQTFGLGALKNQKEKPDFYQFISYHVEKERQQPRDMIWPAWPAEEQQD